MLNKKHNLKAGKSKDKKKGFETEKQDRKPKKEKILQEKEIAIENVHVVLFRKQKQRRKKNEKETNKKQETKRKQRRKTRRKKERQEKERERDRER